MFFQPNEKKKIVEKQNVVLIDLFKINLVCLDVALYLGFSI